MIKNWIRKKRLAEIKYKIMWRKRVMFHTAIANPDPNKIEPSRTNAVNGWLRIERWYEKRNI